MSAAPDGLRVVSLFLGERRLVETVEVAESLSARMRGLLGRDALPAQHGMLILPCPSVHTFCMQFALDLIFVDRDLVVVNTQWDVPPNRIASGGRKAHAVIEIAHGWMADDAVSAGDALRLSD